MLIKLMSQSPMRSIFKLGFADPAYLVLCLNRDLHIIFLRTNFNRHTSVFTLRLHHVFNPRSQSNSPMRDLSNTPLEKRSIRVDAQKLHFLFVINSNSNVLELWKVELMPSKNSHHNIITTIVHIINT